MPYIELCCVLCMQRCCVLCIELVCASVLCMLSWAVKPMLCQSAFMHAWNALQPGQDNERDSNDRQAMDHMQEDSFFTTGMHRWQTCNRRQTCNRFYCALQCIISNHVAVWDGPTSCLLQSNCRRIKCFQIQEKLSLCSVWFTLFNMPEVAFGC